MRPEFIPSEDKIFAWIEEVFGHGVRRPGYPADRWAEDWLQEQFRELGLEHVRAEPVEVPYWEAFEATLTVSTPDGTLEIPCFPLPHSAATDSLEADLVAFDPARPEAVEGAFSLYDVVVNRVPQTILQSRATWSYDPDETYVTTKQILPFGREIQNVMEPSIAAGAAAFIGVLRDYPGDSHEYYVPYDAVERPIPGVWISGSDGERLREQLARGQLRATQLVDSVREMITAYNIVGELPGADEEMVIIGSHHDGPWASAVEDGSGIALVLAQAEYWSRVPQAERPHRLLFLLNAGHMAGGVGQRAFVEDHAAELDSVVLELHLEHAANEFSDETGVLAPTGRPESRWWFTSLIPRLQDAVRSAIEAEDLRRSMVVPPTMFGPKPTTDGADFYLAGVPLVNYLTAPFYLFDAMDTPDKIHRPSLVPITRAAIRIIESTGGVSAAGMRAGSAG
jgi:Peptidase family M28